MLSVIPLHQKLLYIISVYCTPNEKKKLKIQFLKNEYLKFFEHNFQIKFERLFEKVPLRKPYKNTF